MNLSEIVRSAREYGKIMFENEVSFFSEDDQTFYIDERTKFDIEANKHMVKPIAFELGYYKYICPNCSRIHAIHKTKVYRDFIPPCNGMLLINGKLAKLNNQKIHLSNK